MRISNTAAKKALEEMFKTGDSASLIVSRLDLGLLPIEEIVQICYYTVCENPDLVAKYREGNDKILNAIVGKVMAKIRGKAIGSDVEELIKASISYIYQFCPLPSQG